MGDPGGAAAQTIATSWYWGEDRNVIDYEMYEWGEQRLMLRGPPPVLAPGLPATAFLGAAQTFGRFAPKPFQAVLGSRAGIAPVNFARGGAGPGFFLAEPGLVAAVNRMDLCVVQVMSARSVSTRWGITDDGNPGWSRATARARAVVGLDGPMPAHDFFRSLFRALPRPAFRAILDEYRSAWVAGYACLLRAIRIPKILLWFSGHSPRRAFDLTSVERAFGGFPQLVDEEMVGLLRPLSADYAEVVTNVGLPQALVNRFTGQPEPVFHQRPRPERRCVNGYYPSPEMHAVCADALQPVLARHLGSAVRPPLEAPGAAS